MENNLKKEYIPIYVCTYVCMCVIGMYMKLNHFLYIRNSVNQLHLIFFLKSKKQKPSLPKSRLRVLSPRGKQTHRGCRRNHGAVWTRNTPRGTRVGLPSQLIVGNAERSVVTTGKGAWGDSVSETQRLCRGGNAGEKEMLEVCARVC